MDYAVVNILDYMELIGEESVVDVLSGFSCPKNKEIENFVRNNAVEFAKRKMSITYLLLDEYSRVLAIFAITWIFLSQETQIPVTWKPVFRSGNHH